MSQPHVAWIVDPEDPRAPPADVWARMSEAERARVVASLPSDFPVSEANPPEGDRHFSAFTNARATLSRWFQNAGRRVYVSGNLPVYYPGERMFSPDVIAVVDVDPHERESWIVSHENGRGLDFALEVVVSGRRRKDYVTNVERYADLGIPEYFVFDRTRLWLCGWRLGGERRRYERMVPQHGRYPSRMLGLDLSVDGERLRFSVGDAALPDSDELIAKLGTLVNDAEQRMTELERALEREQLQLEEEQRRREAAEAELERARAEIEELKRRL